MSLEIKLYVAVMVLALSVLVFDAGYFVGWRQMENRIENVDLRKP